MEGPLFVLCLNCQEMINSTEIQKHSHHCLRPTIDTRDPSALPKKIANLSKSLETFPKHHPDSCYYEYILQKSKALNLVEGISVESVEKTCKLATAIKKFAKSMIKPGLILYSERLRELASEKTEALIEQLADSGCSQDIIKLLNKKFREVKKIQSETENFTGPNRKYLADDLQAIDDIASQISRILTQRSSTGSLLSVEEDFGVEELDCMNEELVKEMKVKTKEDLQKYFYTKCLMVKFMFGPKHPSQMVQIGELYKEVRKKEIPVEQWDEFIKGELSFPERWVRETESKM